MIETSLIEPKKVSDLNRPLKYKCSFIRNECPVNFAIPFKWILNERRIYLICNSFSTVEENGH